MIFEKTPPMASYLVLLTCGKFEWLEDEVAGIKLRIMTTTGKKEFGRYALEVTKKTPGILQRLLRRSLPAAKA